MMAVAESPTYGMLNRWPWRVNVSEWHFNQITGAAIDAELAPLGAEVYVQHEREEIARGIADAVQEGVEILQYYPRPTYLSERIPFHAGSQRSSLLRVKTPHKWVQAIGSRASTLIQDSASVAYTDEDGDGVNDTATITVTTTATATDEVQAFFRVADRAGNRVIYDSATPTDERWRIEPLSISISGGTATLTGHRALFAKPTLWAQAYAEPNYSPSAGRNDGDVSDATDFVTAVDVYRVYADSSSACRLKYYDSDGAIQSVSGTATIENEREGVIRIKPSEFRPFFAVDLDYQAGYPPGGDERSMLETAFLRLANCRLPAQGADNRDTKILVYQWDTLVETVNDQPVESTPLGQKRGEVYAYKVFKQLRISTIWDV